MRLNNLIALIVIILAAFTPALLTYLLAWMQVNPSVPYKARDIIKVINTMPWQPVIFGLAYASAVRAFSQTHNRATREEVFAFTLISALIHIILSYGGALGGGVLAAMHVNFVLFYCGMFALFISLAAWKGLYVNLGGAGVFMTTLLGTAIGAMTINSVGFPIDLQTHYLSIIGTFMAFFSAFDRA